MFKQFFVLILFLGTYFSGFTQNKVFTLDDVISGGENYKSFVPATLKNLQWVNGADAYSFTKGDSLLLVNAKTGKKKLVLSSELLHSITYQKISTFPEHQWLTSELLLLNLPTTMTIINVKEKKVENELIFPEDAANTDYDIAGNHLAYTIENNLYIATTGIAKIAVTFDNDQNIVSGQSYHRNEFGISKGTFWSPKGNLLAYARKDESKVGNYPLVNIESREATVENIKYPMAGMASEEVTIGIYNPKTAKTIYLQTGEPTDQYLTNLAWSPDEKMVYLAVLNREQNQMKLNSYDASTGVFISTLFEEHDEQYVEPSNPMVWRPGNDSQFIWQSLRDGHNHLYLFNTKGELIQQLTKGEWDVTDFQGFDPTGNFLFYTSTEKSPLERHSYRLSLADSSTTCLTNENGTHKTQISISGNYALDNWSSLEIPRKIDLIDVKKNSATNLLTAADPYADYELGASKIFMIKSEDQETDLYCRMITPPQYDPTKKYPVIVYVYGGPHDQEVVNEWMGGARMWQHYMAQKGYIAFTLDNRGSAGRGSDFEQVIHRQLGVAEMADQMKGIEYLKTLPYVDSSRIGVHGWSYGGFMTTSLLLNHPETFKVGVAGGPVIDWKYYEIMYGERYMDTPQENPEGYLNSGLLDKVANLKGRLLIIHGAIDPTVVWQHSLAFVNECVKQNVQLDYFVYPRHKHNVRGKERIHLMEKVSRYFDDFL
ncbi:MAG: DPP IV N-terminal domain-containing protein [Prolixibacteraceae bacterium]